ncbi:hypothetical protein AB0I28_00775 [Phytomonospora sp. NPDC050363]|uniref:hypothetical protein n=1 Tax=Phytomonospora sp. NPDC050363 TaxID=3155642 RepID=UPI0033F777BA
MRAVHNRIGQYVQPDGPVLTGHDAQHSVRLESSRASSVGVPACAAGRREGLRVGEGDRVLAEIGVRATGDI